MTGVVDVREQAAAVADATEDAAAWRFIGGVLAILDSEPDILGADAERAIARIRHLREQRLPAWCQPVPLRADEEVGA